MEKGISKWTKNEKLSNICIKCRHSPGGDRSGGRGGHSETLYILPGEENILIRGVNSDGLLLCAICRRLPAGPCGPEGGCWGSILLEWWVFSGLKMMLSRWTSLCGGSRPRIFEKHQRTQLLWRSSISKGWTKFDFKLLAKLPLYKPLAIKMA